MRRPWNQFLLRLQEKRYKMRNLFNVMRWDFLLLYRHGLVWVSLFIALLYGTILFYFRGLTSLEMVTLLIFSDPVMMGFIFIGAITMLEKDAGTFQAIIVSPLRVWQYLWSKALCLTLVAMPLSMVMVVASGHGFEYAYYLLPGVGLSSVFFVFLGFSGAARVFTFNQYIIIIPLFLLPLCFPLVQLAGINPGDWIYLIPTQASITIIQGMFIKTPAYLMASAITYLLFCTLLAFLYARHSFKKYIVQR